MQLNPERSIAFQLLEWFKDHGRTLPWRETNNPYFIWISEVILQQTRIEQGISYFYKFIERFPDVYSLAEASQDEVLKYWEGLGYYSRARNMHHAAKHIVDQWKGTYPTHYNDWLALKGIGPYTARAIGSFAFGNPTGVIDGNVLRVMSRILADTSPINEDSTRKKFQTIIDNWVQGYPSREFNFAMMDLGATICTPTKPGCLICPLNKECHAFQQGQTQLLPVKKKKLKRKTRYFHFYIIEDHTGKIAIRQRSQKGLWGGLWEIPNEEVDHKQWKEKSDTIESKFLFRMKHVFTHFDMMINVFSVIDSQPRIERIGQFISKDKIHIFAFSKAVLNIMQRYLK